MGYRLQKVSLMAEMKSRIRVKISKLYITAYNQSEYDNKSCNSR